MEGDATRSGGGDGGYGWHCHSWDAVQVIVRRNKETASRNMRRPESALLRNGIAVCGYCGCKMKAEWGKSTNCYRYRCTSHMRLTPCEGGHFSWRAPELDTMAWDHVLAMLEDPELLRKKYDLWLATKNQGRAAEIDRLTAIGHQIEMYERRRQSNLDMAGDEEDPQQRGEYQHRAREAARMIRELMKERESLEAMLNQDEQGEALLASFVEAGPNALEVARHADYASKRRMLYSLRMTVTCRRRDDENPYDITCEIDRTWRDAVRVFATKGNQPSPTICAQDHSRQE
jgi:hypothetical protein